MKLGRRVPCFPAKMSKDNPSGTRAEWQAALAELERAEAMRQREEQIRSLREAIAAAETLILRHEEKIQAWEQRLDVTMKHAPTRELSIEDNAPAMLARGQMEFLVLNALGIVEDR